MILLNTVLAVITAIVITGLFFLSIKKFILDFFTYRLQHDQFGMWESFLQGLFTLVLYVLMLLILYGQL